jgi:small subunit ribosomal protein S8
MSTTDPIADMLTRIRNAIMARHDFALIPTSRTKIAIAKLLKDEGFISDYEILKSDVPQQMLKIHIKYVGKKEPALKGLKRVSKPGLRVYVKRGETPWLYEGLGIAILSTPLGVMTGRQAWRKGIGGEVLCYVW